MSLKTPSRDRRRTTSAGSSPKMMTTTTTFLLSLCIVFTLCSHILLKNFAFLSTKFMSFRISSEIFLLILSQNCFIISHMLPSSGILLLLANAVQNAVTEEQLSTSSIGLVSYTRFLSLERIEEQHPWWCL